MTTIIGLQGHNWSVIGSDSKISSFDEQGFVTQQSILPKSSSKIISKNGYLLGAAGDVRAINLLHHVYEPPSARYATTKEKLDQHITKRVIPSLRQCFDEQGFSPPDKGDRDHKAEQNSTIIICIKGCVYVIEEDYSWTEDASGVYVIGTGSHFARGALHALLGSHTVEKLSEKKALEHVERALQIASAHDAFSGGPFHLYVQRAEQ